MKHRYKQVEQRMEMGRDEGGVAGQPHDRWQAPADQLTTLTGP